MKEMNKALFRDRINDNFLKENKKKKVPKIFHVEMLGFNFSSLKKKSNFISEKKKKFLSYEFIRKKFFFFFFRNKIRFFFSLEFCQFFNNIDYSKELFTISLKYIKY